ncbi:MAG TPA: serine/threonine protein kinase, partial [Deltaproteobacteria bacterium]|nr:serine/threonine protein kinase [Deltaproteobacteria bacterium]
MTSGAWRQTRHTVEVGGVLAEAPRGLPGGAPSTTAAHPPHSEIRTRPMDPEPQIHLELGPLLGSGGFGEVYQARMRSRGGLQTVVAVKVTHPNVILLDDAVTRLRDEGLLLARIQHPVVVRALDLLQIQGRLALVTEYVPGADLTRFVQGPDPIPPRALVAVIGRVASALHAAWSAPGPDGAPLRIVHRDIKPSNIRIGRHGEVRLLDFGIARFQGSARESTTSGVLIGSMPYLAPERLTGCQTLPPADVFGLGCCLYEGLAR